MANAFESLIPTARKIRDAAYEGENTAERVGGLFVELLTAAAEALYGQGGAATLLRELSRDGLLTPGDRLAVEHKATSATITIPTVYADGTSGTSSAVIGAVGNKAGLMLPAHVEKITSVAESLARLPVLPYNGTVASDVSVDAGAPGRILVTAAIAAGGLSVVFQPSSGRFLLSLSVGDETRYFATWLEAADSAGNVVARASSEYSSGRLFSNSADGRRLYLLREGADGQAQLCRIDDDGRIDALRARIDKLAEALEDLPVVDFIRVEDALVAVSDWPGAIQTAASQCGVVYNTRLRLFLLKVASAVSREVSYYSSWDEVRATSGSLLARPSADYQRRPEGGDATEVLSGRLFLLRANGSDPAVLYAWDGGMLRQVNNFAGKITSILSSVADLASQVDGHTNRLWRAEERLGDHEDMISAVDGKAEEARGCVESLEYTHAVDMAELRDLLEDARRAVFNDMWDQACVIYPGVGIREVIGGYDPGHAPDPGHPYRLRELWLAYDEAAAVLAAGRPVPGAQSQYSYNTDIRTNLPAHEMSGVSDAEYPFFWCQSIEVANADNMTFRTRIVGAGCPRLHTINNLGNVGEDGMVVCNSASLVNLTIRSLTRSIDLSPNPLISRGSLEQITANAKNTVPITIKLHADTFAKICGDTENAAAAALDAEELARWMALADTAAGKSITFVTA